MIIKFSVYLNISILILSKRFREEFSFIPSIINQNLKGVNCYPCVTTNIDNLPSLTSAFFRIFLLCTLPSLCLCLCLPVSLSLSLCREKLLHAPLKEDMVSHICIVNTKTNLFRINLTHN